MFADEKMTAALVDRITHRVHILETNGESYRLKPLGTTTYVRSIRDTPIDADYGT